MKNRTPEWWASLPPERVGKETEAIIEALFKEMNNRQDFAWHRMPDAKAARGRIKAQPADYIYRHGTHSGFLEVKALKHPYRLPAERVTQLPTLLKWELAGSSDAVLVHHYMQGLWRVVFPNELTLGVPSWDLSNHHGFASAEDALRSTGYMPC